MKTNILKYIAFSGLAVFSVSCEPEFDTPLDEAQTVTQSSGSADFSQYVALGNSLTAGFADGALYIDGQRNSFATLLAKQMEAAGGGDFKIPLMQDNIGGFSDIPQGPRLVFDAATGTPIPIEAESTTSISNILEGPFNNMGVPGAKSFHLTNSGYGSAANLSTGLANPYFVRMASSPSASIVEDAVNQNPTFFSLWIGNNDILGYATAGGTGGLQTDLTAPPNGNDVTNPLFFGNFYGQIVSALTANGAKGILANIPDINTIPYFTTIPNNALVLTAEQAASLTGFFQAYSGIVTQGIILNLTGKGLPLAEAQATATLLGSQYAYTFNEGPNRFIIKTEVTDANPQGIKQMSPEELLVFTIDQNALRNEGYGSVVVSNEVLGVLGKLATGGTPTAEEAGLVLAAVKPIEDNDVLEESEIDLIKTTTDSFNTIIAQTASNFDIALIDVRSILRELKESGINVGGSTLTTALGLDSAFSLDGIHLNPRGNAELTNRFIDVINSKYGSTLQKIEAGNFKTVTVK